MLFMGATVLRCGASAARIERSEIRDEDSTPAFALLKPGYACREEPASPGSKCATIVWHDEELLSRDVALSQILWRNTLRIASYAIAMGVSAFPTGTARVCRADARGTGTGGGVVVVSTLAGAARASIGRVTTKTPSPVDTVSPARSVGSDFTSRSEQVQRCPCRCTCNSARSDLR